MFRVDRAWSVSSVCVMPLPVMLNLDANLLRPGFSAVIFNCSAFVALLFAYGCPRFLLTCLGICRDDVILEVYVPSLNVPWFFLLSLIDSLELPRSSTSLIAPQIAEKRLYECTILFIEVETKRMKLVGFRLTYLTPRCSELCRQASGSQPHCHTLTDTREIVRTHRPLPVPFDISRIS